MESVKYPFYGSQFHPEKQAFSFYPDGGFNHSPLAIMLNRYFGDFFIHECRRSNNSFASFDEEMVELIENYDLIMTNGYYSGVYSF